MRIWFGRTMCTSAVKHAATRTAAQCPLLAVTRPRLKILPSLAALSMRGPADGGMVIISSSIPRGGGRISLPENTFPWTQRFEPHNVPKAQNNPSRVSLQGDLLSRRSYVVRSMMIQRRNHWTRNFASSDQSNCFSDSLCTPYSRYRVQMNLVAAISWYVQYDIR